MNLFEMFVFLCGLYVGGVIVGVVIIGYVWLEHENGPGGWREHSISFALSLLWPIVIIGWGLGRRWRRLANRDTATGEAGH